jgi:hypothetical protein
MLVWKAFEIWSFESVMWEHNEDSSQINKLWGQEVHGIAQNRVQCPVLVLSVFEFRILLSENQLDRKNNKLQLNTNFIVNLVYDADSIYTFIKISLVYEILGCCSPIFTWKYASLVELPNYCLLPTLLRIGYLTYKHRTINLCFRIPLRRNHSS